jgi:hypothetical protein
MNRTFNKAANHNEAELWDILQQIKMTPRQRQRIAYELKSVFIVTRHLMLEKAGCLLKLV